MPWPKYSFQTRFTNTRAVSGLSGETVHLARSSRVYRPFFSGSGGRNAGVFGVTTGPDVSSQLPRARIRTVRGGPDVVTSTFGIVFSRSVRAFVAAASASRSGFSSGADVAAALGMKVATVFVARSKVQKMLQEEIRKLEEPEAE